jgi:hypothetical protein
MHGMKIIRWIVHLMRRTVSNKRLMVVPEVLIGELFAMGRVRQLLNNIDLALGLGLSVVLGSVVGLAMSHPLGHLILGSALGVMCLCIYVASYSLGAIWMMGAQQGLLVVSVFVWTILLSSWLSPAPEIALALGLF